MDYKHETIFDDQLIQLHFTDVFSSDDLLPAHWHEHLEMLYILEGGEMTAWINDTSYLLKSGDIFIVNPGDIHYTHSHHNCRYCLLQIPEAHLARISSDWELLRFTEYLPYSANESDLNRHLAALFLEMNQLYAGVQEGSHLLFLSCLYQMLYLLYTEGSQTINPQILNRNRRDLERMRQTMEYVRAHYRENISLSDAAERLCVTPEHFCRLFKKYTGQTFFTYVNQIRLAHFYQDLIQTDDSITYLLDKNGIANYKSFLRSFKEIYGTTPKRLRQERQMQK